MEASEQQDYSDRPPHEWGTNRRKRSELTHDGKRDAMTPLWEAERSEQHPVTRLEMGGDLVTALPDDWPPDVKCPSTSELNAAQAQRSEQQEWTAATVSKLIDTVSLQGVADAHNAALAAEHQRREQAEAAQKTLLELAAADKQQLVAERQQLLAAQAAIAEALKHYNDDFLLKPHLDILHEHDAEIKAAVLYDAIKELQNELLSAQTRTVPTKSGPKSGP